jgi:O-antigen ligase
MGLLTILPSALVVITGNLDRRLDAFRELAPFFPSWYRDADRIALFLLAALAGFLLLRRLASDRVPVHTTGLFALLLWTVAQLSSGLQGGPLISPRGALLLLCLLTATTLPRGRGACLGAGVFGVTLAIASSVLGVFRHDIAFVAGCEGACGGLGFSGVLPNENLLGVTLVVSIPFVYLGFRGHVRLWFVLYLAGMAIATGSRTAVVAAIAISLALLIVRPQLDSDRKTPGRGAIAGLVLVAATIGSVYVALHHWNPYALTTRPLLWRVASSYIHRSPWFGYGPEKWSSLYGSSEIPLAGQRSTHNLWMDVLFVAGIVGAVLLVALALAALWSSGRARPGVLLVLATILMVGTTEGSWSVGTLDLQSFSLVALILTGATGGREAPPLVATESTARPGRLLPASNTRA